VVGDDVGQVSGFLTQENGQIRELSTQEAGEQITLMGEQSRQLVSDMQNEPIPGSDRNYGDAVWEQYRNVSARIPTWVCLGGSAVIGATIEAAITSVMCVVALAATGVIQWKDFFAKFKEYYQKEKAGEASTAPGNELAVTRHDSHVVTAAALGLALDLPALKALLPEVFDASRPVEERESILAASYPTLLDGSSMASVALRASQTYHLLFQAIRAVPENYIIPTGEMLANLALDTEFGGDSDAQLIASALIGTLVPGEVKPAGDVNDTLSEATVSQARVDQALERWQKRNGLTLEQSKTVRGLIGAGTEMVASESPLAAQVGLKRGLASQTTNQSMAVTIPAPLRESLVRLVRRGFNLVRGRGWVLEEAVTLGRSQGENAAGVGRFLKNVLSKPRAWFLIGSGLFCSMGSHIIVDSISTLGTIGACGYQKIEVDSENYASTSQQITTSSNHNVLQSALTGLTSAAQTGDTVTADAENRRVLLSPAAYTWNTPVDENGLNNNQTTPSTWMSVDVNGASQQETGTVKEQATVKEATAIEQPQAQPAVDAAYVCPAAIRDDVTAQNRERLVRVVIGSGKQLPGNQSAAPTRCDRSCWGGNVFNDCSLNDGASVTGWQFCLEDGTFAECSSREAVPSANLYAIPLP